MIPEARVEQAEHGLVPEGDGWFVVNAREVGWRHAVGRPANCDLEGKADFTEVGINITALEPGVAMAMYHWEADQEDFLVLSGAAILIVEGAERALGPWDFVHCPPGTRHTIVGAGAVPCVIVAVGAREHQDAPGWGGYTVDEAAIRHGAGVARETTDQYEAYANVDPRVDTRFREGWLPE